MDKFDESAIWQRKADASELEEERHQWLGLAEWQSLSQTPDRDASDPGGELPGDGCKQNDGSVRRQPTETATVDEAPADETAIRRAQSRAVPSLSPSGIRRTIYWAGGKPVSLAYVPALADEHPEVTND